MPDITEKSFSPYAPIRHRSTYWWQYATHAARTGLIKPNGFISGQLPELIMSQLIVPLSRIFAEEVKKDAKLGEVTTQWVATLMEQRHWVPLIGQYELNGRQIFDLDDTLVEMLAQTDIEDCSLQDWHPPYDAFFVRFGKQDNIKLPFDDDFEYLDGAFVAVTPWDANDPTSRRIKFGFTMVHQDGSGVAMPGWFLDLSPDEQRMPIIEGFEASIRRRIASFAEGNDTESSQALADCRAAMLTESVDLIKQAVHLVVNSMFYIESLGTNTAMEKVEPGRDTPVDAVVAWHQAPLQKRAKLKSRLTADGYALVHLMGTELHADQQRLGHTGGKKAHWRRGHWRMQRKGPQLSLSERKWIKPTMVKSDLAQQDELPGHIYTVGGQSSTTQH